VLPPDFPIPAHLQGFTGAPAPPQHFIPLAALTGGLSQPVQVPAPEALPAAV
jgi:hypothetical protein